MAAKTPAERKADYDERQLMAGLVRKEFRVTLEEKIELEKLHAKQLKRRKKPL